MPNRNPFYVGTIGMNVVKATSTGTTTTWAVTVNNEAFEITTDSLTCAVTTLPTMTITNSSITATSKVYVTLAKGTASTWVATIATVTPSAGQVIVVIQNIAASGSFNGTFVLSWFVVNAKGT